MGEGWAGKMTEMFKMMWITLKLGYKRIYGPDYARLFSEYAYMMRSSTCVYVISLYIRDDYEAARAFGGLYALSILNIPSRHFACYGSKTF